MTDSPEVNNEEKKMDWMYRDSSQIVDREEYLLGRKVDKQFEKSILPPDKDQECLPSSIFSGIAVENQVDMARKLQDDPLYLIKKKEIESREQLLKNPRKLKQLQEMVARQRAAAEKLKRKQLKKKKKNSKDVDRLLVQKCKKLFGGLDAQQLAALEDSISSCSSSSASETETHRNKKKKKGIKDLDKLLAMKYKQMLGNIDAKGLAELSDTSSSETSSESEKQKKRKLSMSSSEESSENNHKSRRKGTETRNNNSSSKHENKTNRQASSKRRDTSPDEELERRKRHSKHKVHSKDASSESDVSYNNNTNKRKQVFHSVSKSAERKRNYSRYDEDQHRIEEHKKSSKDFRKSDKSDEYNEYEFHKSKDSKFGSKVRSRNDSSEERSLKSRGNKISNNDILKNSGKSQSIKEGRHKTKRSSSSSSERSSSSSSRTKTKSSKIKKCKKETSIERFDSSREAGTSKFKVKRRNSSSSSEISSNDERHQPKKQFGLVLPANYVPKKHLKEEPKALPAEEKTPLKREQNRKLTEKEKEMRLKEMMSNAKWREDLRDKNIKAHKEKMKAEKDDYVYNEDFMRNQMAIVMSQGTVESRVKANINTIQRSKQAMSEHFARRK